MNWSSVVFVGVIAFSLLYWFLLARHTFTGPVVEVSCDAMGIDEGSH